MNQRHKVFVSYHHRCDQTYRDQFEHLFNDKYDIMVSKSVQIGDINPNASTEYTRQLIRDNYLRDSTVTVVLIGKETWKRKHVDWEISSSLRNTRKNRRSGLIGILLPSYPDYQNWKPNTIPPRLYDNLEIGFATIHKWSTSPHKVQEWIDDAFSRRNIIFPNNSRPMFAHNRSADQKYWQ